MADESWSALAGALKSTHPCFDLLTAYKRCVNQCVARLLRLTPRFPDVRRSHIAFKTLVEG
jgi:hypothetical protein